MEFTKMHGLGNDFLVFEDDGTGRDWNAVAEKVCTRRLSVGGDGIMVVLPSTEADVRMRIINADGSEAEMCGNGIRCFAKYVYEHGIVNKEDMTVETLAGIIKPKLIVENGRVLDVCVDMGVPKFDRASIPMQGEGIAENVEIEAAGRHVKVSSVLMGVPHTMVLVDDIEAVDATVLGPAIERHSIFPRKSNVNFVQVLDSENIRVLTWERGAGLTLACGTGSCASGVATYRKGLTGSRVNVHLSVGRLIIETTEDGRVLMTGPAEEVYTATLNDEIG